MAQTIPIRFTRRQPCRTGRPSSHRGPFHSQPGAGCDRCWAPNPADDKLPGDLVDIRIPTNRPSMVAVAAQTIGTLRGRQHVPGKHRAAISQGALQAAAAVARPADVGTSAVPHVGVVPWVQAGSKIPEVFIPGGDAIEHLKPKIIRLWCWVSALQQLRCDHEGSTGVRVSVYPVMAHVIGALSVSQTSTPKST